MQLPMWYLFFIIILVIVLAVIFLGLIDPILIKLGLKGTEETTDKSLLCSEWTAKDCGSDFYNSNAGRFTTVLGCSSESSCKQACRGLGFCL